MNVKLLSTYSITHALIDATCAGFILSLLGHIDNSQFFYMVIIYNIIAFGLQAPFGYIADILKKPVKVTLLGIILTGVGALVSPIPWIGIILLGLGNALFHVGGGIISLNITPKKATAPGIYVAPGALGLAIGGVLGKTGYFNPLIFVGLLLIAGLIIWKLKIPNINYNTKIKNYNYLEIIILFLLISIGIRAIVGLSLTFMWKENITLFFILITGIVLGKALGGILGDKIGWMKTAIGGLLLSAVLLAFCGGYPVLAIIGAFLFNFTMPITLVALSNSLPGRYGFSFGLTTLFLLIGALIVFLPIKKLINSNIIIFLLILISAGILYIALKKYLMVKK